LASTKRSAKTETVESTGAEKPEKKKKLFAGVLKTKKTKR
jgi:hypothetical protein